MKPSRIRALSTLLAACLMLSLAPAALSEAPGEVIHIPRGSSIQFSVHGKARFLYFVYPANWAEQAT